MSRWNITVTTYRSTALIETFETLRHSDNAQVLRAEVINLLEKGAIEIIPPAQS